MSAEVLRGFVQTGSKPIYLCYTLIKNKFSNF